MENYKKSKIVEKPFPIPFANLPSDIIEMKVKDGSKIRNLMGYAIGKMESDSVRQILFTGSGKAVSKTITCVEIMKRRLKELHQITKVLFRQTEEIWEPIVPEAGLDALTVKRNIPAICVLLSKDALDPQEPGYQAPGSFDAFWIETLKAESQAQTKRKQGGGRGLATQESIQDLLEDVANPTKSLETETYPKPFLMASGIKKTSLLNCCHRIVTELLGREELKPSTSGRGKRGMWKQGHSVANTFLS